MRESAISVLVVLCFLTQIDKAMASRNPSCPCVITAKFIAVKESPVRNESYPGSGVEDLITREEYFNIVEGELEIMEVGSLLEDSYINCPPCAEMYKTGERIAFKAAKKNSFINPGAVLEPGSIITCPVDYVADQEGSFYNFSDIVVKRPFRK